MALNEETLRTLAFVGRCCGAATVAYVATLWIGLPHPIWSTMSALIVSQEKLDDTRASLKSRILGTLIGIGVGLAVSLAASPLHVAMAGQIAISVAIAAVVARKHPALRVCMWTGPIVLLTAEPPVPIALVAVYRASEVIIGAVVGVAFHSTAEIVVTWRNRGGEPDQPGSLRGP